MFALMYKASGQDLDLHEQPTAEPSIKGQINTAVESLAQWCVNRQQQKRWAANNCRTTRLLDAISIWLQGFHVRRLQPAVSDPDLSAAQALPIV